MHEDGYEEMGAVCEALEHAGADPRGLRRIEFDLPGRTLHGWALDDGRLPQSVRTALPHGWGVRPAAQGDDETLSAGHGRLVGHRMDIVAPPALAEAIDTGALAAVDGDDWGFTDMRTLAGDAGWGYPDPACACGAETAAPGARR
ncbi:MAG: hypothetical protein U0N15_03965 [Bifidobacterium choerinum]